MRIRVIHILILFFTGVFCFSANAQNWAGFETGRFSGVSSANLRPGGMSPMAYKVDATLLGVNMTAQPKMIFGKNILDVMLTGGFTHLSGFSQLNAKRMHAFSNIQGPSIQAQISPRASIAFTWNARNMWLSRFSNPQASRLFDNESSSLSLNAQNESARALFTGWNEFGLGGAGVLWAESFHSISIGGFAKLAFGTNHMSMNISNFNANVSDSSVSNLRFAMQTEIAGYTYDLVDEARLHFTGRAGYAFDFGFEYKFLNPRACPGGSNYRAKAGFSLTDIGKVRYASATRFTRDAADVNNLPLSVFRQPTMTETVDTLASSLLLTKENAENFSVMLPMALRAYTEINAMRRLIFYGEFHFIFAQLSNPEMPVFFRFNFTPRFEDERFGVYLPLTATNYTPFHAGLAIRLKPLIIGSENLFSFWAYDDRGTTMNFYVKLKIPILNDDERTDWKIMMQRKVKKRR